MAIDRKTARYLTRAGMVRTKRSIKKRNRRKERHAYRRALHNALATTENLEDIDVSPDIKQVHREESEWY